MHYHLELILFLLLLCSCHLRHEQQNATQPLRCEVQVVKGQSAVVTFAYTATVQEQTHIPLNIRRAGTVTAVCVSPNVSVHKGDVLLRIDDTSARQALRAAKASLDQAEDALERTQPLHEKGLVADIQWQEILTKHEQAQALYLSAEEQVSACVLTAPADGVITYRHLHVGEQVTPAQPVMTLLNIDAFVAQIYVPEAEMPLLHIDDSGVLRVPAIGDKLLPVRLTRKDLHANALTHTYIVEAVITKSDPDLLPGMVGTVAFTPHTAASDMGIVISQQYITILSDGTPAVWLVDSSHTAYRQPITVDGFTATGVRVMQGLKEGDILVTHGQQKLYNGAQVAF